MTKFETIGVSYQVESRTKEEALHNFQHSCYVCCMRGMHIECARCAIEAAHKHLIAAFETKSKAEEVA